MILALILLDLTKKNRANLIKPSKKATSEISRTRETSRTRIAR
jgi:hypothetical protein